MKTKLNESGITLIALIITIIVLVILAAVTLNSIFGSNIIGLATNGAINYAEEQQKELGMLNDVSDLLGDITGDTDRPMSPTITLSGTKGSNDIYTSNVTVTISINKGLEQTGTIKLHYKINDGEEQITEEDVSFEVSEEGTTTIIAWTENEKGNLSDNYETSFTINKTAPTTPTINLNGTEGENGYYISDVGVTISAGDAADVASIKYKVEGANPIEETEATGTTVNFDITQDGTSTITAYIINNAGLTSEEITQVVNKDATVPSTATIALSGEAGETSISVTANGEDATSGVASYIFQYSTTSEKEGFTTALEVQNTANSCTYPYQGLASNTTYYLRVVVKDRAGHTAPSTAVNATTKKSGLSDTVLASNVGKYVDYTPVSGTFDDHVGATYSGDFAAQNTPLSTETNLKWKILEATDNKLTLISETATNVQFYLGYSEGYNNAVLLLNNACKAMYSNNSLGATGRSMNINDIENHMTYDKNSFSHYGSYYGNEYTGFPNNSRFYPNIFARELNGAPNGTYGTEFDLSEQDEYITDIPSYSEGTSSFKGKFTYYSFTMSASTMQNQAYVDLFSTSTPYFLASRCVSLDGELASFRIFFVADDYLSSVHLFASDNSNQYTASKLRPIVEIDLTKVNVGLTGDGSADTPFSIETK